LVFNRIYSCYQFTFPKRPKKMLGIKLILGDAFLAQVEGAHTRKPVPCVGSNLMALF